MEEAKYVKLEHVQELLKLMKTRDMYMDWTDSYEEESKKVDNYIELLEMSAVTL